MEAIAFRVTIAKDRFFELSVDERAEVQAKLDALDRIARHPDGVVAGVVAESVAAGRARGWSRGALLRKFYAFKRTGDWRVLIDRNRVKEPAPALSEAFVEFWRSLCEENQRKCRPAYRKLVALYRSGAPIPGYEDTGPRHHLPRGWTYSNLMRFAPTKYELAARRRGRSAAAEFRPKVFTTRVGLKVGQYYVFDDLEHDVKVNMIGVNRVALRPLELGALDLLSGCKIAWGVKPTLENDDGSKQKLKEREMRFLLAHVLYTIGYRPEGTVLMAEHGTAAIREDIERLLLEYTDGAVTVQRSGIEGAPAFAGAYCGRPKGNFRFKAALESLHNLVHNELAALPGQMGMSRDRAPEELHGRDRHNDALLRAISALPERFHKELILPFVPFSVFLEFLDAAYRAINSRTDHDLEGWLEAGFVCNEFRLFPDAPWMPMSQLLALPEDERRAVAAVINKPGHVRQRKLSPREVWDSGRGTLQRISPGLVSAIIGTENAVERRLGDDHLFEFEDRELGPGVHRFEGLVTTSSGAVEPLVPGETYLVAVNPISPSEMFVSRPGAKAGAFLGVARRWEKVSRADTEALHRQMGRAAKIESALLAPVARRGAEETRRRIEASRHNAEILRSAGIAPEARALDMPARVSAGDLAAATSADREEDGCEFSPEQISDILKDA